MVPLPVRIRAGNHPMSDGIEPRILIVDDARDIREPLGQFLRRQGYRTRLAADAAEARRALTQEPVHLAIVDVMMPGEDGLSLCRALTSERRLPVILLTARAEMDDRVTGLELGADDYVVKPFNPRELLARIRAVLRRTPPKLPVPSTRRRRFAGLVHDPAGHRILTATGQEIALTSGKAGCWGCFWTRRDRCSAARASWTSMPGARRAPMTAQSTTPSAACAARSRWTLARRC